MELQHVSGNTYAIKTHTSNIGLYLFKDQHCLLIDSGTNQTQGKDVLHLLRENGWTVYAIFNTHSHADHCGGNHYIQSQSHCRIYASAIESAFIENPILIPYAIYGSYPIKLLQRKFLMPQASRVSDTIREGYVPINGRGFEILALGGHTLGHLGIRTPDDVVFTGDSLIPPDILHTNPFLYLADPSQQKLTIENLRAANSPLFYLSHGGLATDIPALINANHEMMEHLLLILKNIIHSPRTQEEIINEVIAQQDLQVNRNHYFRLAASISAFLAYLCNDGQASVCIKNNIIQYCAK